MQISRRFTREGQDPFAGIEFAGGDFPQKIPDAVPVLPHTAHASGLVHGNHRGSAGMADEVQVVFSAVCIAKPLGRYIDDAAAVNVMAGDGLGLLHAGKSISRM